MEADRRRSEYLRPHWRPATAELPPQSAVRPVEDGDRAQLASVLLDAYRGTIDDEGENEQDALQAIDFSLATIVRGPSVVVTDRDDDRIVAMSFVVVVGGRHFIDPVATAADRKGHGLGTVAVEASVDLLHEAGIDEVGAVITDGNRPSERLFTSLGFERIGPWPRSSAG